MTKPLISPDIIETLAGALARLVADGPRILADARATEPPIWADSDPESSAHPALTDFLGRVLEHCVGRLDGSRPIASRTPARDAALTAATLRAVDRWPAARAREAAAWRLALALFGHDDAALAPAGGAS